MGVWYDGGYPAQMHQDVHRTSQELARTLQDVPLLGRTRNQEAA